MAFKDYTPIVIYKGIHDELKNINSNLEKLIAILENKN